MPPVAKSIAPGPPPPPTPQLVALPKANALKPTAPAPQERRWACEQCAKRFGTLQHLNRHIRMVHNKDRPHACETCSKRFGTLNHLNAHIRTVHQKDRPHACETCSKTFSTLYHVNEHVRTVHNKDRPHACETCSKRFGTLNHLNAHIRTVHQKDRPHACSACEKTFGQQAHLNVHVRTVHANVRPHACAMCGKRFGQRGSLNVHVRTVHAKDRPYACAMCSKRFGQRSSLNVHVRTLHDKDWPYTCDKCGKTYVRKSDLANHLRKEVHLTGTNSGMVPMVDWNAGPRPPVRVGAAARVEQGVPGGVPGAAVPAFYMLGSQAVRIAPALPAGAVMPPGAVAMQRIRPASDAAPVPKRRRVSVPTMSAAATLVNLAKISRANAKRTQLLGAIPADADAPEAVKVNATKALGSRSILTHAPLAQSVQRPARPRTTRQMHSSLTQLAAHIASAVAPAGAPVATRAAPRIYRGAMGIPGAGGAPEAAKEQPASSD